jgi:hypothetical protein
LEEIVIANSSSNNYVTNTNGTMTALSVEWMAKDMNTGLQFPLGTSGPTHPLVQCLPTGVDMMMIDLAYEHVTDTLFFTYCCIKIQILF